MKNKILSFLSVLICLCFFVSPLCVGAEVISLPEILLETIFSEFIGNIDKVMNGEMPNSGAMGAADKILKKAYETALEHATADNNGDIQLTLPTFDIITGKEQLQWTVQKRNNLGEVTETFTDDILIEVTFLLTNSWSVDYLDPATGVTYYSNALNIAITRTNGSVKRYVVVFGTNFDYSRNVLWSYPTISIAAQGGCTLYSVEGGVIGQALQTNFYTENCIFTVSDTNSITTNLNDLITNVNAYPSPIGIYSRRGGAVSADGINYPVDVDICHGCFNFRLLGTNNSTKYEMGVYCNRYLKTGFTMTNNSLHAATNNTYYSVNNYSNNYYNYPISGGTVIDKNNYQNLDLPALAPVFDIDTTDPDWLDTLLALLPSLLDLLDVDLLPDLADLLGRLLDFFGNMPDIGLQWNPDTSLNPNNYWELDFPSDDSGGGGSGGDVVPWDPPEYPPVNTQPFIPAVYPTLSTTYTYPTGYLEGMGKMLDNGWDMADTLGLTAVLVPSVIILLLWRFTGK